MKTLILITFLFSSFSVKAMNLDFTFNFIEKDYVEEIVKEIPSWDNSTKSRVELYGPVIVKIAKKLKIDPKLLLSIAWAESHFNPEAKSVVGALGIMQVKPITQKYILKKSFRKNHLDSFYMSMIAKYSEIDYKIIENLIAGALYVKYLLKRFNNDAQKAVVAYNIGPTGAKRLIRKDFDLDHHRYYLKISKNIIAMN
jgi:soluble lytic murein transglycosylase-like protein